MWSISKRFKFSAAHILPRHPGKCQRLHGHNYVAQVFARGTQLDDQGMVMDFGKIKESMEALIGTWDHRFLIASPYVVSIRDGRDLELQLGPELAIQVPDSMCVILPVTDTTAELLAGYIVESLASRFSGAFYRCELQETQDSVGIYEKEPFSPFRVSRL